MKLNIELNVDIPEGITANVGSDNLVEMKKGDKSVSRRFKDHAIAIKVEGNQIILHCPISTRREKMRINTYAAHVRNMVKGILEGHRYELKICSGHFPMNVTVTGTSVIVKNFIGEKVPRTLTINKDAKVTLEGEKIVVESHIKEVAGQVAASIEELTKRPGFDKRIFQDGIYITMKDGKPIKI